MDARDSIAAESADRELVLTRVFNAPRSVVFKAWTEKEHLLRWWGPKGFTLLSCDLDLRPGGSYRFHMRGPDGDDHWSQGVFREILPPKRLALTWCWADAAGNPRSPETTLTLTFEEHEGKTKLTLRHGIFESVTARDEHRHGWSSSFDCLDEYLGNASRR